MKPKKNSTEVKAIDIEQENLKNACQAIEKACKQFNCQLSVAKKIIYGQTVYVPVVENVQVEFKNSDQ